ncbi:MAG: four helix bundle protein [bacterium]
MNEKSNKFKEEFEKRLVRFSIEIIRLSQELSREYKAYALADQLLRAGTSIGANIIEARASGSKRDYIHYFQLALKSANETKYWLYLVSKTYSSLENKSEKLRSEAVEISKIIATSIRTMKGL